MTKEDKIQPIGNDNDVNLITPDKADLLQKKVRKVDQRVQNQNTVSSDVAGLPRSKFRNFGFKTKSKATTI